MSGLLGLCFQQKDGLRRGAERAREYVQENRDEKTRTRTTPVYGARHVHGISCARRNHLRVMQSVELKPVLVESCAVGTTR